MAKTGAWWGGCLPPQTHYNGTRGITPARARRPWFLPYPPRRQAAHHCSYSLFSCPQCNPLSAALGNHSCPVSRGVVVTTHGLSVVVRFYHVCHVFCYLSPAHHCPYNATRCPWLFTKMQPHHRAVFSKNGHFLRPLYPYRLRTRRLFSDPGWVFRVPPPQLNFRFHPYRVLN